MKKISVCSPIMNEQECFEKFYGALSDCLEGKLWELILVDDGSSDDTPKIVRNICEKDSRVKYVELAYNHGKARAATTAFNYSSGDYIIYMDTDLQDPPERILDFCNLIDSGFDVVYGVRQERNDNLLKKVQSALFWRLLKKYTNLNLPIGLSVMRGFNKDFKNRLLKHKEYNRFLEGIFFVTSGTSSTLEIEHRKRYAGDSKFNLSKKLNLALNAILDFSDRPLVWSIKLGIIFVCFSMLYFLGIFLYMSLGNSMYKGWPSLVALITFFSGVQIILVGMVGLYVGKSYLESKNRPNCTIERTTNLDNLIKDIVDG